MTKANRKRVLKLAQKVRELLKPKKNWVQGRVALNEDNISVRADDPEAIRFCLEGAIFRLGKKSNTMRTLLEAIKKYLPYRNNPSYLDELCIAEFNDTKNHKQVLALLDKVIRDLKVSNQEVILARRSKTK
jgi:hypothetical protein